MIAHDPSLVILSITIAILGAFTASVMMSNLRTLEEGERRVRAVMASLALGGSVWAMQFVGLLSLSAPINFAYNPLLLALSATVAFAGTATALFLLIGRPNARSERFPFAVAVFGLTIAATNYLGLTAIAGRELNVSWFLTLICIAVSLQAAGIVLWFLFRPRGVTLTLLGSMGLGFCLAATHYLSIDSARALEQTLLAVPPFNSGVPTRYLAWSATIMMYLLCSICLCIFVVTQFRDDAD